MFGAEAGLFSFGADGGHARAGRQVGAGGHVTDLNGEYISTEANVADLRHTKT